MRKDVTIFARRGQRQYRYDVRGGHYYKNFLAMGVREANELALNLQRVLNGEPTRFEITHMEIDGERIPMEEVTEMQRRYLREIADAMKKYRRT